MINCAKCGKELNSEDYESYTSIGDLSYGLDKSPFICVWCKGEWERHITMNVRPKDRHWFKDDWRKHFEKWLGYTWNGKNLMALERVVFT